MQIVLLQRYNHCKLTLEQITHHLRPDSPKIEGVEVGGLVLSVDIKTKMDSFLLCDGTSTISCISWKTLEMPQKDEMILVRGDISLNYDDEYVIALKSWNKFTSIKDEVMWFSHCAYLHRFIYPKIIISSSNFSAATLKKIQHHSHTTQEPHQPSKSAHWDKAKSFLGSSFIMNDVIQVLRDKWNIRNCKYDSIVIEWINEGLIFRDPSKQFYSLDDGTNRESLHHIINNVKKRESKRSSPHPRYIWNCLKQLGYLVSPKLI